MRITDLAEIPIDALYRGFVNAFSDYKVPFRISPGDFLIRLEKKLNIRKELSVGILDDNEEVSGFIFHTLNQYENKATIYNGGTGVLPDLKRRGLAEQMYEWCLPGLMRTGADRILLEVIISNEPAINLYRKVGFMYKRTFKCFKVRNLLSDSRNTRVSVQLSKKGLKKVYSEFKRFEPSFIDSDQQLIHNLQNETIIEAMDKDKLCGYAIFQPRLGRISQIAIHPEMRGKGIGSRLLREIYHLSEKKELTVLNIPEDEEDMIRFLERKGFINEVDQYEMELYLK